MVLILSLVRAPCCQVAEIAGDQTKGAALGSTLLLGSFSSLVCAPMFGSMSDTCTMQFVRDCCMPLNGPRLLTRMSLCL